MGLLLRLETLFDGWRAPRAILPILVLDEEQPFVLNARAAHQRLQADSFGHRVRTLYHVLGAAGEVVPSGRAAQVGHLAAAELLKVVRRRHAAGVEKVLILA